jgi:hypothetical protein
MNEATGVPNPWNDPEFEEVVLSRVAKVGRGYELTRADGWSFFVDDPGFEIVEGLTARFIGRGIGHSVRGLIVVGANVCFYRTREEHEQYQKDMFYPQTAVEAMKRWDKGEGLFTIIRLGGIGPGYEQAIHVTIFELIRAANGLRMSGEDFWRLADTTLERIGGELGLSGAQAGIAKNFAFAVLRDGWQKTILAYPDERRIQVSDHWPKIRVAI